MDTRRVIEPRELGPDEIAAILARNHVGRLALARGSHVDIEPIHYVYDQDWIYGRTSRGRKLETTGDAWWPVAFEVDEIEGLFRWRSVVVHGGFYPIPPDADRDRDARERAIRLLRRLVPRTFAEGDPVPYRDVLFRIAVQEVTGRAMDGPV